MAHRAQAEYDRVNENVNAVLFSVEEKPLLVPKTLRRATGTSVNGQEVLQKLFAKCNKVANEVALAKFGEAGQLQHEARA